MALTLGIDASGPACSVALVDPTGRSVCARQVVVARGHAVALMPLLAELLADRAPITLIGVGVGPGSFTGLRVALAAALGYGLGRGVPVLGIDGFRALAAGADLPAATVVIDARPGAVPGEDARHPPMVQAFADGRALAPPAIIPVDQIAPHGHLVGQRIERLALRLAMPAYETGPPRADVIARLAQADHALGLGQRARPLYLKPPDVSQPKERR